jgi:K+-sensing histidine kinase KdpD
MIYAAPPLLKTVFENVFDNAVKYKKPDQPRARLLVSCAMDRDGGRRYVTVSVRDEGVGMDEQRADLCFYKGKGTGESWGQGLYFAKYVVGLHAGKIRIGKEYTAPGTGTEIIINLPFVEEAPNV